MSLCGFIFFSETLLRPYQFQSISVFTFILWYLSPLLFQVGGAAVLGVGVWTLVEKSDYLSLLASSTFAVSAYILILAGSLVVVTGFLGCCAVIREQRSCLSTVRQENHRGGSSWTQSIQWDTNWDDPGTFYHDLKKNFTTPTCKRLLPFLHCVAGQLKADEVTFSVWTHQKYKIRIHLKEYKLPLMDWRGLQSQTVFRNFYVQADVIRSDTEMLTILYFSHVGHAAQPRRVIGYIICMIMWATMLMVQAPG